MPERRQAERCRRTPDTWAGSSQTLAHGNHGGDDRATSWSLFSLISAVPLWSLWPRTVFTSRIVRTKLTVSK
jgi:hypothetical protein